MSARAFNWACEQKPKTTSQKLVLLVLGDRADEDGFCFPGTDWIARKCSPMPRETARRVLRELSEQSLVVKEQRRRRQDGTLGVWELRLPIDHRSPVHAGSGHGCTVEPPVTSARADSRTAVTVGLSSNEESAKELQRQIDAAIRAEIYGDRDVKLTDREARKVALAATSIRKAGGTAEDVHGRCEAYRKHKTYGGVALTAPALREHWSELSSPVKKKAAAAPCVECGIGGGKHLDDCPLTERKAA